MLRRTIDRSLFEQMLEKLEQGVYPQWVMTDPEIFELEKERIFGHTWLYLAHETELKKPGDFVTRWMVHDPVLLVKNRDGEIKAFLNSCTHRGTILCAADRGNSRAFTCPYHGWTFNMDGELIDVVAGDRLYGDKMKRHEWNLRPIPRVESYHGLIFGNLDPNAMPLTEYLGDMKWYLDILLKRSDGGVEVRGTPQRWLVKANWKNTFENFTADTYHVQRGHGLSVVQARDGSFPWQATPPEARPMFERNLAPDQVELLKRTIVFVGGVFPNFCFLSPVHRAGEHMHNYLTVRIWRPVGPEQVEVWS